MKIHDAPLFGTDISEWQPVVGAAYPHEVFKCRVHNGYRLDRNFVGNRDAANRNPRVKVKVAYIVPVAGMNLDKAVRDCMTVLPKDWAVMIDEESGPGFAGPGDHSATNNALREKFLVALGAKSRNQVIGYANSSDWATGWRNRGDTPGVVAGYSATMPALARQDWVIGWQYCGGDPRWSSPAGWPRGAAGIGQNIDMNVYGFPNGDAMHAWMFGEGVADLSNETITDTSEEDDMATFVVLDDADGKGYIGDLITRTWIPDPATLNDKLSELGAAGIRNPHTGKTYSVADAPNLRRVANIGAFGVLVGPTG